MSDNFGTICVDAINGFGRIYPVVEKEIILISLRLIFYIDIHV